GLGLGVPRPERLAIAPRVVEAQQILAALRRHPAHPVPIAACMVERLEPGPIELVGLDHEELLLLIERLHGVFLFFRSFDPNRKTTPRITQEFVTRPPTR